jgi:hypothetical protein
MGSSLQGRAVFAAMLAAHAALFLLLTLALKPRTTLTRTEFAVAPVYLADLRKKPRPKRDRVAAPQAAAAPVVPPVLSRPADAAGPAVPSVPAAPAEAASDGDAQQLARTLRGSRVGCANPSLLSEAEQLRCQDELEKGSKLAKYIPTPIPAERRAYYDAIVKEKRATPNSAIVPSAGSKGAIAAAGPSIFAAAGGNATRGMGGQTPGFACKFAFGGPKGTNGYKKPPNSLRLGRLPCAITPPTGPLSPEANIRNPDTVINDPKKAAER